MKKSKKTSQGISGETLLSYQQQCEKIESDWTRLRAVIDAYPKPNVDRNKIEGELMSLKSRLSCDYPVLTYWRKGGFGLSAGINKMLSNLTDLSSFADAAQNPESRLNQSWQEVRSSLKKVNGTLGDAQAQLAKGKEAHLPDELIVHNTHRPFPVKKALKGVAVATAVLTLIATLYVMRNFLGFWAPGAGEGLTVDASMTDEQKIESVLLVIREAFKQDSVDMLMTVFARDFKNEEGRTKTEFRVGLKAYQRKGDFKALTIDWAGMSLLKKDGFIYARSIKIATVDGDFSMYLGFKPYGEKLLIATASGT